MHAYNNVEGTERLLSLAVGVVGAVSGIRQGGVVGLIKIAASALIAQRGITGHCQLKDFLSSAETEGAPYERHAPADLDEVTISRQAQDREAQMDNALEETFPASDPISP
ncbi:DUF2892 domain-containing protein [Pseudomonas sp. MM211]|uniref:YgaP family membrane protein n=1 Tax=Pseudomonas sp. MM211 TaxID=2866808 RepID=UPI001CECB2FC|nr:DUF2892 domain-containing protein [Pseudomonas sp. MM211]UCJ15527.1 DUF2892 domain-containing protein [Pseudomonas sp. MM211]